MAGFETKYLGELRTENTHLQSGTIIHTDAPTDNQGKGQAFSPTDLCALSLTVCIITTMGIYCDNHGYHMDGVQAKTIKHMASDPRRIAKIEIKMDINLREKDDAHAREGVLRIVRSCPVSRSLHPDVDQDVHVEFV
jgi:putative redox protein